MSTTGIFLNELRKVDPEHPLVEQDVHDFLLDEDELLEDNAAERRPKGHQGFI